METNQTATAGARTQNTLRWTKAPQADPNHVVIFESDIAGGEDSYRTVVDCHADQLSHADAAKIASDHNAAIFRKDLTQQLLDMIDQRNLLLAACKGLLDGRGDGFGHNSKAEVECARAAVARAEGK
jgi:hypothetical protein